jgi:hypothetical protein
VNEKIKVVLATIALVVGVATVNIATAEPAAAAYENCSGTGKVCTYWDINGGGAMYYYTGPYHSCINIGYPWNDNISSIQNKIGVKVRFYQNAGCNGAWDQVGPYCNCTSDHLNTITWPLNDALSSLWIGNDAP